MRVFVEKYEAFCQEACIQAGYRPEVANAVAHYLVRTDMMGIHSHGTRRRSWCTRVLPGLCWRDITAWVPITPGVPWKSE